MSDLILCHSALAENPYYFVTLGVKIYSIEELCFVLKEKAGLLDEDVKDEGLCDFLIGEAGMPRLGERLKEMLREGCSVGEFVTTIFEASCYLNEEELQELTKTLVDNAGLDRNRKHKLRGDGMLRSGKYAQALDEYRFVLGIMDRSVDRELYAAVLHNMGTAYARMFLLKEASECFYDSYEISGEKESVLQFLLASHAINSAEQYDRLLKRYGFNEELKQEAERRFALLREPDEDSPQKETLDRIGELKESGQVAAFYRMLEDTIDEWKDAYRASMGA
ncbi:MAG: hypothetical protein K6G83_10065 [Lachnospiraceae bacterium]|nr:hypothetical protein [Lachnospiraceae bacterium]